MITWAEEREMARQELAEQSTQPVRQACPHCGGTLASRRGTDDEGMHSTRLHCTSCLYSDRPRGITPSDSRALVAAWKASLAPQYVELEIEYDDSPFPREEW